MISKQLLGKIVDEVFDGAIEDPAVIEEIYSVIKREEASSPTPVSRTSGLKPVPYDHAITLQSVKASSGNVDDADPRTVLLAVLGCTETWVGEARIIGNVRAIDVAIAIRAALSATATEGE